MRVCILTGKRGEDDLPGTLLRMKGAHGGNTPWGKEGIAVEKETERREIRMEAASATECTGMEAVLLQDEEQAEAIEELYPLNRQKTRREPPFGRSPIPPQGGEDGEKSKRRE